MQHSDTTPSAYYQSYQAHFQNPNPPPSSSDPYFNTVPSTASAPPVASSYTPSNFSNYPPYPSNTDHIHNPNPNTALLPQQHVSHLPYSFPHLDPSSYPYDPNQAAAVNYDQSNLNPSYNSSYYSYGSSVANPSVHNYDDSLGYNANFRGYDDVISHIGDDQGVYNETGAGVYKYTGGKSEGSSGAALLFDDYGRPIVGSGGNQKMAPRVVKAAPKVEEQHDVKGSVQKFRVKLLSESFGQDNMDVLCQVGLDGILILEPATSRTLKMYPLEAVTRWEVLDSHIFAFWTKTSVDIEPRRVRLKSNPYTTNNILDTVTAASIQVKEIGDIKDPSYSIKETEQSAEKKKGLIDWRNLVKPGNEEKDHWVPDEAAAKCVSCAAAFNAFVRKHHCRNCGDIFCDKCTQGRIALTADEQAQPVRVCDQCMAEVTQRLSNTKEAAVRAGGVHSHEDLVRKLKEEMEKNRKSSTGVGVTSNGSGKLMREVACPTCTVHLQVEVPATGSETIECSVCQHPFRVSNV